jgi:hypothetical protein
MRVFLVTLLVLALVPFGRSQQVNSAESEDDIREALLNYIFEHGAPQQKPYTKAFFISIDKKDPDDNFMARFKGHTPIVKKASEAVVGGDMGGVSDKKTRDPGILFSVSNIKWIGNDSVEVDGGYYVAWLFAGGCTYRLVQKQSKWTVAECSGCIQAVFGGHKLQRFVAA